MNFSYRLGWLFFRFVFRFYFGWRVYHPERVPMEGPAIIAANHASFIDPPLVGSGVKRGIHYLARASAFRFPVFGALLKSWDAVPLDREGGGASGIRIIRERLEAGQAVVLFPEGTRSPDGGIHPAKSGIGLLVAKSAAPVVPVRVFGTYEAYSRHVILPRPRRVAVKYGKPMMFEALREEVKTCSKARLKEIYAEIAEQLMQAIEAIQPGPDQAP